MHSVDSNCQTAHSFDRAVQSAYNPFQYYRSLAVHPHHNYYEGRAGADLTAWLEYFMTTLAEVFALARDEALELSAQGVRVEPDEVRRLDHRARVVLALFNRTDQITTAQVAVALGLSPRTHAVQCSRGARVTTRLGGRGLAGSGRSIKPQSSLRVIGNISAIYRQQIGIMEFA